MTDLFQLKEELYLQQNVSIAEFVLLINGIFTFDDFCDYTKYETNYCFEYIEGKLNATYPFLTKYEVIDAKRLSNKKVESPAELKEYLEQSNLESQNRFCPKIVKKLNALSEMEKKSIYHLFEKLVTFSDICYNNFPAKGFSCKSLINETDYAYPMFSLFDWIKTNFNLHKGNNLPLTSWSREYFVLNESPKIESSQKFNENNDTVRISTLPKFLQLLINTHIKSDWSKKPNNKMITKTAIDIANQLNIPNTPSLKKESGIKFDFPKVSNSEKDASKILMTVIPKIVKPD